MTHGKTLSLSQLLQGDAPPVARQTKKLPSCWPCGPVTQNAAGDLPWGSGTSASAPRLPDAGCGLGLGAADGDREPPPRRAPRPAPGRPSASQHRFKQEPAVTVLLAFFTEPRPGFHGEVLVAASTSGALCTDLE